ncbi:hypothetical protein HBI56_101810 [Parastagonospora nodorum]|nr:hypothetical protein HBH53_179440 [Parastagonospora nodorum]KAH3959246.1 hypothetical protein HBH51_201790 [Parastagonospora nodorum]KAH3985174.1 hypothetical protein HBH52_050100 [Parastagonospora nodorum]KAH4006300.1 hypothetical protein HBI10_022280 [Parastagonospora nodorum]KAH4011919.1 hypothetical protein HBI13_192640 [Parastagonospora nodorum]
MYVRAMICGEAAGLLWRRCDVRSVDYPRPQATQSAVGSVFILTAHCRLRWIAPAVVMPCCCGECCRDMAGERW